MHLPGPNSRETKTKSDIFVKYAFFDGETAILISNQSHSIIIDHFRRKIRAEGRSVGGGVSARPASRPCFRLTDEYQPPFPECD